MNTSDNLMRSLLFVPGHNDKLLQSAASSKADVILLDVEDSVLPTKNKAIARRKIQEAIQSGMFKKTKVYIRINERNSGQILHDVFELTIEGVDGFLFSKTNDREDIVFFDRLLESIEYQKNFPIGKFKIIPILETAASIVNSDQIAKSSNRITTIGFGSEDYVSDMEAIRDFNHSVSIFTARSWIATVAHANKMQPIDAAYIHVHDLLGLEKHLEKGKLLGFGGMWVLHPKQIPLVHKFYSPSKEEVENAIDVLRIYELAEKDDRGVAIIEGKFVGPPLVVAAKKIIKKHEMIQAKESILGY